ncbi:MAG: hypothetical protein FWE18_01650 [Alphaproteobacteria bacterium]|nr:hypothetical protein [Alphaproteobacteria bacterium]
MENKLDEEDVAEYKKMYVELLKVELSDLDFTLESTLDDLYAGLQETPEGFPSELIDWHKNELIYEFSKDYKPKKAE